MERVFGNISAKKINNLKIDFFREKKMTKSALSITTLLVLTSAILFSTTTKDIEEVPATHGWLVTTAGEQDATDSPKDSIEIPSEIISEASVGEVVFPHLEHYEDFEIKCVECHHEMNAKNINIPHEEYFDDFWINCEGCHINTESKEMIAHACSNCHNSHPTSIADEMISKKVAIHKNCWRCHDLGTGLEASESCAICHVK